MLIHQPVVPDTLRAHDRLAIFAVAVPRFTNSKEDNFTMPLSSPSTSSQQPPPSSPDKPANGSSGNTPVKVSDNSSNDNGHHISPDASHGAPYINGANGSGGNGAHADVGAKPGAASATPSNGAVLNGAPQGSGDTEASSLLRDLTDALAARRATIGVMGMGYVGLPLSVAFAEAGFPTVGFDISARTIEALSRGKSHVGDVDSSRVQALRESGQWSATVDLRQLKNCDAIIICVPTPLTPMREPDLSAVRSAVEAVRVTLRSGQLVVLESTTYPGTTDEVVRPVLEATGMKAGRDFFLAFSPERIDPGNTQFPVEKVPKVVGGYSADCLRAALALYQGVVDCTVPVSSTQAAELTKLLENIFRSVNIALVNEMALLCDRMGIDVWEVIDAAATKPYGFTRFSPGPGLGGHCIPIDPFYLAWKARQYDFQTSFIELAGQVNRAMPHYVIDKITRALNDDCKAVRGARIAILGMSYKPDVGDCRESPSLRVAELLLELGAEITFHDPHVPTVEIAGRTLDSQSLESIVPGSDCVALLTDHSDYDYPQIAGAAHLVVDTRNAFRNVQNPAARIIKL